MLEETCKLTSSEFNRNFNSQFYSPHSLRKSNITHFLLDGKTLEFIIKSATEYTGIPLKDLALKPNNLIVCIGRKRQIILPSGEDCIEVGDSVVVITMEKHIEDIRDIMI